MGGWCWRGAESLFRGQLKSHLACSWLSYFIQGRGTQGLSKMSSLCFWCDSREESGLSSRFSCMAPGMEKYSLDLSRAVKSREYAMKIGCVCVCMGGGVYMICTWFQPDPIKTFYSTPTPPTHRKLLQTTEKIKLGLLSLPSRWFFTGIWHTPCPARNLSRTSTVKPCCANNNKATDPREGILSYKILYRILNFWNATLLTFHFPGTVQHNFVPKFHTHSLE